MDIKFNINNYVKVKLTNFGIELLKEKHNKLNDLLISKGCKGLDEFKLNLDSDGYYKDQLWSIMKDFGQYCKLGSENPFETEIIFKIDNK